jgi:hypothetical protein
MQLNLGFLKAGDPFMLGVPGVAKASSTIGLTPLYIKVTALYSFAFRNFIFLLLKMGSLGKESENYV